MYMKFKAVIFLGTFAPKFGMVITSIKMNVVDRFPLCFTVNYYYYYYYYYYWL
jgi:hypothetical protein